MYEDGIIEVSTWTKKELQTHENIHISGIEVTKRNNHHYKSSTAGNEAPLPHMKNPSDLKMHP